MEVPFDYEMYYNTSTICIKPVRQLSYKDEPRLGIFKHCTSESENVKIEEAYYKGLDKFYYYDIKICHTLVRWKYKEFINELLRRGKTQSCVVHISNSLVTNEYNSITPLYEIPYFMVMLKHILTMESNIIIEISNKRYGEFKNYHEPYIKEVITLLESSENVKHYIIREEPYERIITQDSIGTSVLFDDSNTETYVLQEVKRYPNKERIENVSIQFKK